MTDKKRLIILIGTMILVTFVSFYPTLLNDFTNWDDESHLLDYPLVRSLSVDNVKNIFTDTVNATYIPLTTLSFAIEYHLFKFTPFVYHLTNLLLHIGITLLVFWFGRIFGLSYGACFWGALLFGIHPMHVESVAWVTERKDVLYGFFYLLSVVYYLHYVRFHKLKDCFSSYGFGILSMLAKPMALSLPLILFVCDWLMKRSFSSKKLWLEKIPYFLYCLPIAWITYSLNSRVLANPVSERILIWVWSFGFYIRKFFFPYPLVPLYDLPKPVDMTNPIYLCSVIFFVGILVSLIIFRKARWYLFSVIFYCVSIFFLLRFDHKMDISLVADRFMYLPSVGFCLWFGYLIGKLSDDLILKRKFVIRRVAMGVVCALLVLFSFMTYTQGQIWHDSIRLYTVAIKHNSNNPFVALPYYNRGKAYDILGEDELALADYNNAISLKDDYYEAYNNRANLYGRQGQLDVAMEDINRSIAIKPDYARAHNNKGIILADMNRFDEALASYNKALELDPDFLQVFNNRGLLYFNRGKAGEAIKDFDQAIAMDPSFEEYYINRGAAFSLANQSELSLKDFDHAIELFPEYADAYYNRGNVRKALGRLEDAIADFRKALEYKPNYTLALNNLGTSLKQMGDLEGALDAYNKLIDLGVETAQVYNNRAVAFQEKKQLERALKDFMKAEELDPNFFAVFVNRGNLHLDQRDLPKALADYNRGIELSPELPNLYYLRSNTLALMGRYIESLQDAMHAKEKGYKGLEIYIAKLERLIDQERRQKEQP